MTGSAGKNNASLFVIGLAALASGCAAPDDGTVSTEAQQFRSLTRFVCDEDQEMTVQRSGESLQIVSPRGVEVVLPPSPPGQQSRFQEPPYSLVVDDAEALWMVNGKSPIACKR